MSRRALMTIARLMGGLVAVGLAASASASTHASPGTTSAKPDETASADAVADDGGEARESLRTESAEVAWQRSGFRMALGAGYGYLLGLGGPPSGRLMAAKVRLGLRLDARWSALASFEYALASEAGGLSGVRFTGTVDPTWHITPWLSVAVGLGFGGIVEGRNTGRDDAEPLASTLETSYTFPRARPPIARCSGIGAVGLARVQLGQVLGHTSRLTVAAEVSGQWTGCVSDTNRFEPDTGKAIVRRQFWAHAGGTLSIGVQWR